MHNIYYLGLSGERSLPFGLLVDQIFFILLGNKDNHKVFTEFEIGADGTKGC